jgi:hypothetical protein
MMSSENDEIKRIGNKNCWIKKWISAQGVD